VTKHRDLNYGDRFPEAVADALMEFISTLCTPNFILSQVNTTTLRVAGSAGDGQVGCAVMGKWRYNAANADAAHPGGAAATYNVFVTASDNNFVASGGAPGTSPENDLTVYTFGLQILAVGSTPATALYRQIGSLTWDGSQITDFVQTVGWGRHHQRHEPGGADALTTYLFAQLTTLQGTLLGRPTAAVANTGFTYLATDVNGGTSYRSNGATWTQQAAGVTQAPQAHETTHLAGGSDAIPWTTINGAGTLLARPTAASTNAGYTYLATDVNGGTLYRSDGATWTKEALGATEVPSMPGIAQSILLFGTFVTRPAATSGNQGFYYFATDVPALYQNQSGSAWVDLGVRAGSVDPSKQHALLWVPGVLAGHSLALLGVSAASGDVQNDVRNALAVSLQSGWLLTVQPGYLLIQGTDDGKQGLYCANVDAAATATMGTHAPGTNPRIDAIVAQWNDPRYTGRTPAGLVFAQAVGNERPGTTLASLDGAPGQTNGPALPPSSVVLTYVLVNTTDATGPTAGNVTGGDYRRVAGPAIWGEDGKRYRLGVDASGVIGVKQVYP
jgi:hypothetical protein